MDEYLCNDCGYEGQYYDSVYLCPIWCSNNVEEVYIDEEEPEDGK